MAVRDVVRVPKRDLPELFRRAHDAQRYDDERYYRPVPVSAEWLPTVYAKALRPRVYVEASDTKLPVYTLHVHDRLWYMFLA